MTTSARRTALMSLGLVAALAGAARAQVDAEGDTPTGGEAAGDSQLRARLSLSALGYRESGPTVDGTALESDQDLLFSDLRARVEVDPVRGGVWGGAADLRLRWTPEEDSARGFSGGKELQVRELYAGRQDGKSLIRAGRQIIAEADALRVDGVRFARQRERGWSWGGFAGLHPHRLSRSLETDYRSEGAALEMPAAGGATAAYAGTRAVATLAAAAVAPRDGTSADPEPTRVFVASSGQWQAARSLDLHHYAVADAAGQAGSELVSLVVGARWRAHSRFRIDAQLAHHSTSALEVYVREYLEVADPSPESGAPIQNNLTLIRIGHDEGRLDAVVSLPARVDLFTSARLRRRAVLDDGELPAELAGLPADFLLDVGGGVRQRDSLAGLDVALQGAVIRGDRSDSIYAIARLSRDLLEQRLSAQVDGTMVDVTDDCSPSDAAMTCTGTWSGRSWGGGALLSYVASRRWLLLADYRLTSQRAGAAGAAPAIWTHSAFGRVQWSF